MTDRRVDVPGGPLYGWKISATICFDMLSEAIIRSGLYRKSVYIPTLSAVVKTDFSDWVP